MLGRVRPSVTTTLRAFSTAIVLPLLIFASYLLWEAAQAEHQRYEQETHQAAQRLAAAIDLELSKMQVAAEALATSPYIAAGDYDAFREQAANAIRVWSRTGAEGFAFVLRDRSGQQVANTRIPSGAPLPKGANATADQEVLTQKRSVIQGLFVGATAARPIVSIRVPVIGEAGEATHVLSMAIDPQRFADIAAAQRFPPGWVGAVLDQNDTIVARSTDHVRFMGQKAPEDFRQGALADSGVWTGVSLNGEPLLGAYERSALERWRSFVGVPLAHAQAPLRRWLWLTTALGGLALGASILLAVPFARTITRSVGALKHAADEVGRGALVKPPQASIFELDEVGRAIAAASVKLRDREAALQASEGRLRATHENEGVGIVEVNAEGRVVYVNDAECRIVGHAREDLLGRYFLDATVPEDYERDHNLFVRQVAGDFDFYSVEKRFMRADDSIGWARISCTAVREASGAFLYAVRIVEDITERMKADARQRLLIDELNHRVKNTLATVQSLAAQTFRQGHAPEAARARFEARLLALSQTHNLLNETFWTGAPLSRVIGLELAPYMNEQAERVTLYGPEIELDAKPAVVLGMVVHELATNAVKTGALASEAGRVYVTWSLAAGESGTLLRIEWIERGGPPVTPPARRGFGTRFIEQAVRGELAGEISQVFAPEGLTCTMSFAIEGAKAVEGDRQAPAELGEGTIQ